MLEPLQEPFMQRALAEVVLVGAAGGALGCWVVFYGLSYAAESLAHSIFPGLVLAAIAGVPLLLGAAPAIVVAALAIALCARIAGVSREAAVAVVVTTMFGLGVLLALSPRSPPGIESLLFGDVFGATDTDLATAAGLAVLAGGGGLYLSYYAGTAGGASVALAIVAVYLFSLPLGRLRGSPARAEATIAGMTDSEPSL
jgi:ABC-type Mn2+/Zn2+ transport system permease subunit